MEVGGPEQAEAWIAGRPDHYEVVVLAGAGAGDALEDLIALHQRRAALVCLPPAADLAAPLGREALARGSARLARAGAAVVGAGEEGRRARAFTPNGPAVIEDRQDGPPALVRALAAVGVPPPGLG